MGWFISQFRDIFRSPFLVCTHLQSLMVFITSYSSLLSSRQLAFCKVNCNHIVDAILVWRDRINLGINDTPCGTLKRKFNSTSTSMHPITSYSSTSLFPHQRGHRGHCVGLMTELATRARVVMLEGLGIIALTFGNISRIGPLGVARTTMSGGVTNWSCASESTVADVGGFVNWEVVLRPRCSRSDLCWVPVAPSKRWGPRSK
jgi:hypothetical protein